MSRCAYVLHMAELADLASRVTYKVDLPGASALIHSQHVARAKPATLRRCFLQPVLKRALEERGGLRRDELAGTLIDAIKGFDFSIKR